MPTYAATNNLLDLLQNAIPEIEKLAGPEDLIKLQLATINVIQKITQEAPGRYLREGKGLLVLAANIQDLLDENNRNRTRDTFQRTQKKVLQVLNAILEMED